MGQLASKEKLDPVKVALVLEWLDQNQQEQPPVSPVAISPFIRNPKAYNIQAHKALAKDIEYIDKEYYGKQSTDGITSNVNTDAAERQPKYEKWRKVNFSEIMEDSDKKRVTIVDIPGLKLLPSIQMYSSITHMKINMANLQSLPPEVGLLRKLVNLDLAHNALDSLPATLGRLGGLRELNLSQNRMTHVPACVSKLTKLETLLLDYNKIEELPGELSRLIHLVQLNISGNPIKVLPVEISRLADLQKLQTEGCPIARNITSTSMLQPISLQEICARIIVRHNVPISSTTPPNLVTYICSYSVCSFCKGPYYESFVKRGMYTDRGEGQILGLEFRLCSEHWFSERNRILTMFAEAPQNIKPLNIAASNAYGEPSDISDETCNPLPNAKEVTESSYDISLPASQSPRGSQSSRRSQHLWPSISRLRKRQQPPELSPTCARGASIETGLSHQNCLIPISLPGSKTHTTQLRSLTRPVY